MDIWVLIKMTSDCPAKAQTKLAELFAKILAQGPSPIFRHLFSNDEDFKVNVAETSAANMVGRADRPPFGGRSCRPVLQASQVWPTRPHLLLLGTAINSSSPFVHTTGSF